MGHRLVTTQQAQEFDIPFIGDDIAKIGRIIDLFAVPCTPTAEIWIYGFFQAIPTLFVTLVKPELIDISIRHRHGRPRKGKRFKFLAQAIFRDALIEIPVPRWVVFRVYEWGQRIGWYLLVADATEQFAINWMSLAYKYNGCSDANSAYAVSDLTNVLQGSGSGVGVRHLVTGWAPNQNFNFPGGRPQPALNGVYRASWSLSFAPYQIPSQSAYPGTSWLLVDNVAYYPKTIYESGPNTRFASGGGMVDVFSTPRPVINVGLQWSQANKFCYANGRVIIERITPLTPELSPDP